MFNNRIELNNHMNIRPSSISPAFKGRINFVSLGKEEFITATESLSRKDLNALNIVLKHLKRLPRLKFALLAPKNEVINVSLTNPRTYFFGTGIRLEHNGKKVNITNNEIRLIAHNSYYAVKKSWLEHVCEICDKFVDNAIQDCKQKSH